MPRICQEMLNFCLRAQWLLKISEMRMTCSLQFEEKVIWNTPLFYALLKTGGKKSSFVEHQGAARTSTEPNYLLYTAVGWNFKIKALDPAAPCGFCRAKFSQRAPIMLSCLVPVSTGSREKQIKGRCGMPILMWAISAVNQWFNIKHGHRKKKSGTAGFHSSSQANTMIFLSHTTLLDAAKIANLILNTAVLNINNDMFCCVATSPVIWVISDRTVLY